MDTIVQVENIGCMLLNYEGLGAKISKLKLCQEHIKARARDIEAILSNVRLPFEAHTQVTEWLERQKKATEESEQLYQDFESCRWFNVVNFVQLWLQTNELTRVFDSLSTTGQFSEGLTKRTTYTDKTQNLTTKFVGHKFEAYKRMVCEWLEKGSVIAIGGICGMGGIGKTALLEDLYYTNESNPDYRIVWITASKDFNITKFQDDVARTLEIYPLVGNDLKRRVELLKTFKLIKNLVIIIDDLWDWISLYELGIPIGENGCRVIISTRSMKVCQAMKCQKIIKMVPLAEEESWELFMEKYGTIQPDAEVYAKDLVSKCNGLPLGVIQLALHMIGVRDTYEWKDVLHRTESLIVDNHPLQKVFEVFQCSYESLIDPQLKKCFLFCSLFPKDFLIEREILIDCFINEGLIGRMESKLVEICTGHIVLNKLESTFLLDSVNETGKQYVKMHSLLRDFAIQVVKSLDIDRKTDNNPEELMAAYGKWANTVAKKLHPGGTSYKFLSEEGIQKQNLEKLIWIAAFMLVGARHPGTTVGAVEKEYRSEVSSLIKELASAAAAEKKLVFEETMVERLCAYSRAVAHVPTALKEFESRNGWFYSLSEKAIAEGKPDPCPLHTAWLKELKIV